ncbi:MAG: GNAT family N-acetyltransferase [Polyangiaceae bacterium]
MTHYDVSPVRSDDADALAAFFDRAGSTCFCRYWHFTGDKNAWLERSAFDPKANEADLRTGLKNADPSALGLCARNGDGLVVGWLKLSTLSDVPKLRNLSVYRRLDLDASALVIGCLLVLPDHRAQGVARALVRGAIARARALPEVTRLYAFPRRAEARLHDEEAWMGPYAIYVAEGFIQASGEDPYPVLVHPL